MTPPVVPPEVTAATLATLRRERLVAIVRAASTDVARRLARAAHEGGIRCIEITFAVPDTPGLVAELAASLDGAVLGVGTVLDAAQATAAAAAGARFAVSPNTDPEVIACCRALGLVSVPGAATPTEIVSAHRAGADLVKVFPCKTLGGPEYVRLVRGPLPDIPLLVTGGIELARAAAYLEAGAVAVGATADLFLPDLVEAADWERLTRRARHWQSTVAAAPRA